jgi:hypothetical protein
MTRKNIGKGKKAQPDHNRASEGATAETTASSTGHTDSDNRHAERRNSPAPPLRFWRNPNCWIAVFTVLIAIANGFYAWFAWTQIVDARLDQRAWVGTGDAIDPPLQDGTTAVYAKAGSGAEFAVIVNNTGKTPATAVRAMISAKSYPVGVKFEPVYERVSPQPSKFMIMPGGHILMKETPSDPIPDEGIRQLRTRQIILYFYGRINYEDVFGVTRETTFCYFLLPDLGHTTPCDTYNNGN